MPSSDVPLDQKNSSFVKSAEKICNNPWITSGSLGSRDAVIVFRTSTLIAPDDLLLSKSVNNSTSSIDPDEKSSTSSSSVIQETKDIENLVNFSSHNNNNSSSNNFNHSKSKVLLPLPKNHCNIRKNSSAVRSDTRLHKLNLSKSKINRPITSPKKRLHDSLSSSDNSISSECDDPIEIESEILKAKVDEPSELTYHNSKTSLIKPNVEIKEESFDNKENLNNSEILEPSEMPASKLNITYKFMNTETRLLKKIFQRHGLIEAEGEQNFTILWTGVHMKPDILRNLTPYQRVNHFPRSYELTRKDRLYKNIEKMQHLRGFKHFDIVPQSFVLPLEYRDLITAHNKYRGPWIVKPAASSRGRGIFIVNSPDQIPQEEQGLVSKYIADPLCIDGHKCDLRVYVLVTSFDPLVLYIYEEGLVRLATVKYNRNAENLWNPCMHLCNYSINKYHSDYIKSSDADDEDVGHKWTLSALLRHLKNQGCDTKQLMTNIEDLIVKSMFACAQSIISACRMFVPSGNNCFELYGFDILIDDTLKPWLLEINLSPSLGIDSPLDTKVKASLICNLLTLVGIPAYSPVMRAHYDSKWTRYRNVDYSRRANSADPLSSGGGKRNICPGGASFASVPLTAEEARIVRNIKLQNARRGGFVRIFPTEDSMQRYGSFLDPITGVPLSTSSSSGQSPFSMIMPHNYNQMLFNQFYGKDAKDDFMKDNSFEERMLQYERALETSNTLCFRAKKVQPKNVEEGKRLRNKVRQLIETGNELTPLQARQAFALYLESVLRRLTQEPKNLHEKLILKFINRVGGGFKAPAFLHNPLNYRIISKDRSAMVAKLLGDFLESYNRDTETYIDPFDHYGMIPISIFKEFLSQAQESDLESILTLHTNLTHSMPFLYNRFGSSIPQTPPIPTGIHGFLKALPSMVPGSHLRDSSKIDNYYKSISPDANKSEKYEKNLKKSFEKLPEVDGQSQNNQQGTSKSAVIGKSPKKKIQSKR